jgi:predicted thioesterase
MPNIKMGESITIQKKVTESDTAINYGSGKLDNLFATPSLVALMIEASTDLLDPKLEEGFITVGKMVEVNHEKPTILGQTISLKVTIAEYKENKIRIDMEAFDEIGQIGSGHHERIVVNKDKLLERASLRELPLESQD